MLNSQVKGLESANGTACQIGEMHSENPVITIHEILVLEKNRGFLERYILFMNRNRFLCVGYLDSWRA
ncbi:MAG: hypothetical protein Q4B13_11505 [Lautropia sp.]|nr:hypothetical protein [Lautropia sp.]